MNDIYVFVIGDATTTTQIMFNILIFYTFVQLIGTVLSSLIQLGRKW